MKWTFAVIECDLKKCSLRCCMNFGRYSDARDFADSMNNFRGSAPVIFKVRKIDLGENFKPLYNDYLL